MSNQAAPKTETLHAVAWSPGTLVKVRALTPTGRISQRCRAGTFEVLASHTGRGTGHDAFSYDLLGPDGRRTFHFSHAMVVHVQSPSEPKEQRPVKVIPCSLGHNTTLMVDYGSGAHYHFCERCAST